MKILTIPPAAQRDDQAIQMISGWIAERGLHCTLNIGMWHANGKPEAQSWGLLLADVARHIANAIQEQQGINASESMDSIVNAFTAEIESPTSKATGEFHVGHS